MGPLARRGLAVLAKRALAAEQEAIHVSGLSKEELVDRILADERLISVAQRVYSGAQTAATDGKRKLLGRLLANAALEATVDIDEMLIHAQILVELESPHIQVLALLQETEQKPSSVAINSKTGGVLVSTIAERLPVVQLYLDAVLTRLHGHSLIEDAGRGTWGGIENPGESWKLSEFGRNFLRMLQEDSPPE